MPRLYEITLYNQVTNCAIHAYGPSRRVAFNRALVLAGEPWLRAGGDKLTILRTLFAEHLMTPYNRTSPQAYASHPTGAGVEFRRLDSHQ